MVYESNAVDAAITGASEGRVQMPKTALFIGTLLAGSLMTVFGQQAERTRPVRERPSAETTATARPSVEVNRPAAAPRVTSGSGPVQSTPSGGGGSGPSIPVQTYSPGVAFSNSDWYRLNSFLYRLSWRNDFFTGHEHQWRYAQGDSPLTPELLDFALRGPTSLSNTLTLLGDDLTRLVLRYQEGAVEPREFSARLKETTRAIRSLAKKIRRDEFLNYLDLKADTKVPPYSNPANLEELVALTRELAETARRIESGIHDFQEKDMSRVVSVTDLADDSLDSLTKRVDRMAKAIERSGTRL